MSTAAGRGDWGRLALVALLLLAVGSQVFWLEHFRRGYLTEWDESGYMQIAILDRLGLSDDGIVGLVRAVVTQPTQAPLVPFATVPIYLVGGTGVFQSLLVLPLFYALLIVATYGLARTLVSQRWAVLATAVTATVPAILDYSRLYHFAVAAAAFATAALWALIRSDGLRRRGPAIAAGACVGLMLLSRTMTLAYLPGLAVAAMLQLSAPGERRRRAVNLALAVGTTAVVAATWYGRNAGSVRSYIVDAGYGSSSGTFGEKHPFFSVAYWAKEVRLVVEQLYGPLAVVIAVCLVAGAVALVAKRRTSWAVTPAALAALTIAALVVEGYVALTSSSNEGTAFALPWLPALVVLAVAGTSCVPSGTIRLVLTASLALVAGGNLAMKSGLVAPLSHPHSIRVGLLRNVPLLDGRGIVQAEVADAGYRIGSPTEQLPALHRRWLPVAREVTGFILRRSARTRTSPTTLIATDDSLFNDTRIRLAAALWFHRYLAVGRLKGGGARDNVSAYARQLKPPAPNWLLVAPGQPARPMELTPQKVAAAARATGFRPAHRVRLPDGRPLTVWFREPR